MLQGKGLALARRALDLCWLCSQSVWDGRNDLRPQPRTAGRLVYRHLVHDQPKVWRQRVGLAAIARLGQLSDGLDDAAQVADSHGASWPRATPRHGRGWTKPTWVESSRAHEDAARSVSSSWPSRSKCFHR